MFCCYLIVFKVCVRFVIFKLSNFTETGADDQVYDSLIHTQSKIFVRNKQLPEITVFGWFFAGSMLTYTGLYKHEKTIVLIFQFYFFIRCYLLITENSLTAQALTTLWQTLQLDIQQISFLQGQNECITVPDDFIKFRRKDNQVVIPHNKLQRCRLFS